MFGIIGSVIFGVLALYLSFYEKGGLWKAINEKLKLTEKQEHIEIELSDWSPRIISHSNEPPIN